MVLPKDAPAYICGHYFEHMWFVDEQNVLYEGHIISVKCSSKSNIAKITATYWKPKESAFLVDLISFGDLYIDEIGF